MTDTSMSARIAQQIFLDAGFDEDEEPDGAGALAVAIFGAGRVGYGSLLQVPEFVLLLNPPRLRVRVDLDDAGLTMALARGVARWWQESHLLPVLDESGVEDLAFSLALPSRGFRAAAIRCACDADALAEEFVCPLAIVQYRLRQIFKTRSGTHMRFVTAS